MINIKLHIADAMHLRDTIKIPSLQWTKEEHNCINNFIAAINKQLINRKKGLTIDKKTSPRVWRYSYNGVQFEKLPANNSSLGDADQSRIVNELLYQFGLSFEKAIELWENRKDED